jgi:hypothetical protein
MITIRAFKSRDGLDIIWNYDSWQAANTFWNKLIEKGYAPDTGEKLSRAYLWGPKRKRSDGPDKAWAA